MTEKWEEPNQVIYLGASIGYGLYDDTGKGWVARLFEKINEAKPGSYHYANLAHAGDRSIDVKNRLNTDTMSRTANILMLEICANDVNRPKPEDAHSIPDHMRQRVWTEILNTASNMRDLAAPDQPKYSQIFLFSAFPKNEEVVAQRLKENPELLWTDNKSIQDLNDQVAVIAGTFERVTFIDIYGGLLTDEFMSTLERDGVHPDTRGHEIIADLAYGFIKPHLDL